MAAQGCLFSQEEITKLLGSIVLDQPDSDNRLVVQTDRQHHNANTTIQDSEGDVEMKEPDPPYRTGRQRYDPTRKYHLPHYRQMQARHDSQPGTASSGNRQNYDMEQPPPSGPRTQANVRTFATPTRPFHAWNGHYDTSPTGSSGAPTAFSAESHRKASKPATKRRSVRPWRYEEGGGGGKYITSSTSSTAAIPVTAGETANFATTDPTALRRVQRRSDLKLCPGMRATQTKQTAEMNARESARRAAIVEKMIQDGVLRHA
ncbi:hypothetical protein PspLS_11382 [Pyricularia sp. CBS 133598]|nr:hypothetical protein PspLS_11382 [Pyricularia sp. CBS 133598]